jgi:hypothetical protein
MNVLKILIQNLLLKIFIDVEEWLYSLKPVSVLYMHYQ